jgi:adenylate cyclase
MRYFTRLLIVLFISASALYAAGQNDQQPSTPEKQQVRKQDTQNPEAYELYLKGRSYWANRTRADLETAISYFNQAIAKDLGYAMAYAGLADAYAVLADNGGSDTECIPKSNAAAHKALELDPTLGRPHAALGYNKMLYEWDFAGGEAEFKKALALDPDDAIAHAWYGLSLGGIGGRGQDAVAEVTRAYQLDPQTASIIENLGIVHLCAREYDEAIAVFKRLADEHPSPRFAGRAHGDIAAAYWAKRMYPQVFEEWKTADRLSGSRGGSELHSAMEQGFRSGGWKSALTTGIEILEARCKAQPASACGYAFELAYMYADLGDKERAFQWLNAAFQQHDQELMLLKTDFALEPLRSDPRFAELVHKVGLPQ